MIYQFCFFLIVFYGINCEVYTSTGHLTTLVQSASGVTKALEQFLKEEYARIDRATQ
jgi:hypothetical protein